MLTFWSASSAIMPVMTRSKTRALAAMAQAPAQAAAAPAAAGALLSPALTATSRETAAPLVTTSSIAISFTSYIFSSTLRIVSLSWQKKWSRPRPRHRTMKQSRPGLDAPQSRPGLDGRVTTRVGTHRPWAFTIFRHAHRWPRQTVLRQPRPWPHVPTVLGDGRLVCGHQGVGLGPR